jgi:ubiquinone/menaquinone biosynthesis C-methylase UbiE
MAEPVYRISPDGHQVDISKAVGILSDDILAVDTSPDADGHIELAGAPSRSLVEPTGTVDNGRTYQSVREDAYFLPNDEKEQKRLDQQHFYLRGMLDGELCIAPVRPKKVLDLCTGTGVWAIQYAAEHPDAEVYGVDLSLIQPKTGLPPNVSFGLADVEAESWLPGHTFDYIHVRLVWTAMKDMRKLLQSIYDHLEPGGWYETLDTIPQISSFDGSSAGSSLDKLVTIICQAVQKFGVDSMQTAKIPGLLREIGFVDVSQRLYPRPFSSWPTDKKYKAYGAYMRAETPAMMGVMAKFLPAIDFPQEQLQELFDSAIAELDGRELHAYWPLAVICGRKPLEGEAPKS